MCAFSLAFLPAGAIYTCYKKKNCHDLISPSDEFCPASVRNERQDQNQDASEQCHGEMFRYTYDNEAFDEVHVYPLKITLKH